MSLFIYCYAECHYTECHFFVVMLSVIMRSFIILSVVMLSVAMLSVFMLSVVTPLIWADFFAGVKRSNLFRPVTKKRKKT